MTATAEQAPITQSAPAAPAPARPQRSFSDLFGGSVAKWIAFGLGTAGIIALLIDVFLAGLYRNFYADTGRVLDFGDFGVGQIGSLGGLAPVLVGLLAVYLIIAQLLFRRSIALGWVCLLLTLMLQLVVGWENSPRDLLAAIQADRYFVPLTLGIFLNGVAEEIVWPAYKVYVDLNDIGISRDFAHNLSLNLLLLIVFVLLGLVLGLFALLARLISRAGAPADPRHVTGFGTALAGAERTTAILAAAILTIAAVGGPAFVTMVSGSIDATKEFENILWIGPLILILEIARTALFQPAPASSGPPPPPPTPEEEGRENPVAALYGKLRGEGDPSRRDFIAEHVPGQRGGLDTLHEILHRRAEDAQVKTNEFFLETLTPLHFQLFSEFLARFAMDRGCSALVICPDEGFEVIEQHFRENALVASELVEIWRRTDAPTADERPVDVFVATPDTIDQLIREDGHLGDRFRPGDLDRLGAIFLVNTDRMDLGLLRIAINRLVGRLSMRRDLVQVAQSESLSDQSNRLRQLLPSGDDTPNQGKLDVPAMTDRFLIVWRARPSEMALSQENWPLALRVFQLALSVSGEYREGVEIHPFLWDAKGRFHQQLWSLKYPEQLGNLDQYDLQRFLGGAIKDKRLFERLSPPKSRYPAAVTLERDNLAIAVGLGVGNGEAHQVLSAIILADYPLARFHFRALQDALKSARTDGAKREALRDFVEQYGPLAPSPQPGPVELALGLVQEFRAAAQQHDPEAQWLDQGRIKDLWRRLLARDTMAPDQLGVNTSKTGLRRLFFLCTGYNVPIEQGHGLNHLPRFKLSGDVPKSTAELQFLRLVDRGDKYLSTRLPLADHGLAYAEGTHVMISGNVYRVTDVAPRSEELHIEADDLQERTWTFERRYAFARGRRPGLLQKAEPVRDIAVETYRYDQQASRPFEIAGGYLRVARRTVRAFCHAGLHAPIEEGAWAAEQPCDVAVPAKLRSAALLKLYFRPQDSKIDQRQVGRIAFTLTTTLQDVLAALFPTHARRLAVVSPQSAIAMAAEPGGGGRQQGQGQGQGQGRGQQPPGRGQGRDQGRDQGRSPGAQQAMVRAAQIFAIARQPALRGFAEDGMSVGDDGQQGWMEPETIDAYDALMDSFLGMRRPRDADNPFITMHGRFSLAVIEDSDHDLGVCNELVDKHKAVFGIWRDYLRHCAEAAPENNYYAFNTGTVPACFAFKAAADIVEGLRGRT
ncbi:MAG: hypothetical protein AAF677_03220 [Pseudomonadota bacterium]